MVSRFLFVCHFSVAGLSHEISACREKCPAVDQSGCEHSRLQEVHFPNHCQCFDAKTVTPTFVSTSAIPEFSWIQRGVDLQCQQSHVAVDTSSRNFGISTIAPAPYHDSDRGEFSGRAVITSTTTASASTKGSPECDDCQKTADFFSCLSISKLCLIDYLVQQMVPETIVSDIVRSSPEAAELLSFSAPLAAAATRVRVDFSGDVVMTPTGQAQQDEDANLRKIVAQLRVNFGHPSNVALVRAIRLSGGSDDAIHAAFKVRRAVCERLTEPSLVPSASLRRWTEFGQCVALDLFMFADITGENGLFLNMLDMVSHYQVSFPVADQNPLTVFYGFLLGWCLTLGVPERLRFDLAGEFESSFSELAEQIGCRLLPAASVSPTQNAPCERAGGARKYRARCLVDEFSIKSNDYSTKLWLCAVLHGLTNTTIGDSGHSPSQWVLGRSLRLPFQLLSRASQLASHQRHLDDFAYQRRVAMLAEAQRSIISTRYNKALSRAFLSHARSANNAPSQVSFAVGDQVLYWRGNNKRKSQRSMCWLGPGIVNGHEGRANVWISHRNAVVKAAGNHVRLAEVEE